MVIEGTMTTGAVVAASMLGSRMIAPMANLCGVLAAGSRSRRRRWGWTASCSFHRNAVRRRPGASGDFHGHYLFENAHFRYHSDDQRVPLRISPPGGHARRGAWQSSGVTVPGNQPCCRPWRAVWRLSGRCPARQPESGADRYG